MKKGSIQQENLRGPPTHIKHMLAKGEYETNTLIVEDFDTLM